MPIVMFISYQYNASVHLSAYKRIAIIQIVCHRHRNILWLECFLNRYIPLIFVRTLITMNVRCVFSYHTFWRCPPEQQSRRENDRGTQQTRRRQNDFGRAMMLRVRTDKGRLDSGRKRTSGRRKVHIKTVKKRHSFRSGF